MDNGKIAQIFEQIGDLLDLDLDGANRFRVIAYHNAAEIIKGYGQDLREIFQENPEKLEEIPGIGHDLRQKIEEILKTGQCEMHQKLLKKYGQGVLDMLSIRGLGPKKVKLFYTELKIDNLEKLKKAAEAKKISKLPRMGEKSELEILKAIEEHQKRSNRLLLSEALPIANELLEYLKKSKLTENLEYAGSLRRGKETIGDIDLLATTKKDSDSEKLFDWFKKFPEIENIIASGPTKSSAILKNGLQIDFRIVEKKSWGAALHYFTGSKEHNIAIRDIAKKHGLKVNEYGIFNINSDSSETYLTGATEEDMYDYFELDYIPPALRENRGEFEAALSHSLPKLIELKDIQGSLHNHTNRSDGLNTLEEMALSYLEAGYKYLAITDHSKGLGIAHGLHMEDFLDQWKEIDALNKKFKGKFHILKGIECDILKNGEMDFENNFLKKFDLVIGSIHSAFNLEETEQTTRLVKALKNPFVHVLGHPTGRLLNQRPAYQFNIQKVLETAQKENKILEINGQPDRLDLNDSLILEAKKHAIRFAINADAHDIYQIKNLNYGILTAQRGWLEKSDVINTFPLEKLMKLLKR